MKKAPIWELSFLCDAECEQRLGVVPKAGEVLRAGKAGLGKAGHRAVALAAPGKRGKHPAAFTIHALLALALSLGAFAPRASP